MSSNIVIQPTKPNTLVLGSFYGFENKLVNTLAQRGLQVESVADFKESIVDYYKYAFVLVEKQHIDADLLDRLSLVVNNTSKTVVVAGSDLSDFPNKNQLLKNQLIDLVVASQADVRLTYLNHLVGFGEYTRSGDLVGQIVTSLKNGLLPETSNPQDLIFPLLQQDALEGVIKSLLASGTKSNIYYLGGTPLTTSDFTQQLIDRYLNKEALASRQPLSPTYLVEDLASQVSLTKTGLNWQPTAHIKQVIEAIDQDFLTPTQAVRLSKLEPLESQALVEDSSLNSLSEAQEAINQNQKIHSETTTAPDTKNHIKHQEKRVTTTTPKTITLDTAANPNVSLTKVNKTSHSPRPKAKLWFNPLQAVLVVLLIALLTPLSVLGFGLFNLNRQLKTTFVAVEKADYQTASQSAHQAHLNSLLLQTRISSYQQGLSRLVPTDKLEEINLGLDLVVTTTKSLDLLFETLDQTNQLLEVVTGKKNQDPTTLLAQIEPNIKDAYHSLSLLESMLKNNPQLKKSKLFGLGEKISSAQNQLGQYRQHLELAHKMIVHAPEILGLNGQRTYLVLLQNNSELRATGGFIGSFALVTFENGVLLDIKVEDVYTADGQLLGYVEPPEPIKRYLGEASWFLRDSNFDPNFPASAENAAWFLDKQINTQVDGVFALNLFVIQKLLEATGPLMVPDQSQPIDSHNFYQAAQTASEVGFFPGSTQKRDFLGKLANTLLQSLWEADQHTSLVAAQSLLEMANNKQFLLYFKNQQVQQSVSELGWSGQIDQSSCAGKTLAQECVDDYLAVVESNFGVNKANFFVDRSVKLDVDLASSQVTNTLTIDYTNRSPGEAWPAGSYKNYLRVYIPKGSVVTKVNLDGKKLDLESKVDIYNKNNKTVVGFLVTVAPLKSSKVEVWYQTPIQKLVNNPWAYRLKIQKQSGTGPTDYHLSLKPKLGYNLISSSLPASSGVGQVTLDHLLESDQEFLVEFAR